MGMLIGLHFQLVRTKVLGEVWTASGEEPLPRKKKWCTSIVSGFSSNAFTTGNPFLGTKLLGFSIGRGLGAMKGLKVTPSVLHSRFRGQNTWNCVGKKLRGEKKIPKLIVKLSRMR